MSYLLIFHYARDNYTYLSGLTDEYMFFDEILNGVVYDNRRIADNSEEEDEGREEKERHEREEWNFRKRKFNNR